MLDISVTINGKDYHGHLTLSGATKVTRTPPAAALVARTEPYKSAKRQKTKSKLESKLIANPGLPMWLADIAVDFNPDDPCFYEKILKPELEKRCDAYGWSDLRRFQNQIRALKRFLLAHYPAVISSEVTDISHMDSVLDLNSDEQAFLSKLKTCLSHPKELLKLQAVATNRKTPFANRVAERLAQCQLYKESFTSIVIQ